MSLKLNRETARFLNGILNLSEPVNENFTKKVKKIMLQGIQAYRVYELKQKGVQKRASRGEELNPVPKKIEDTFEPSSSIKDRAQLLNRVKRKIKAGYYNSEAVNEQLADSFAKAFDEGLK